MTSPTGNEVDFTVPSGALTAGVITDGMKCCTTFPDASIMHHRPSESIPKFNCVAGVNAGAVAPPAGVDVDGFALAPINTVFVVAS